LSRLTTTSNGQARPIRKMFESAHDFRIESNRNGRFESNRISKLGRSLLVGVINDDDDDSYTCGRPHIVVSTGPITVKCGRAHGIHAEQFQVPGSLQDLIQ